MSLTIQNSNIEIVKGELWNPFDACCLFMENSSFNEKTTLIEK
jgi:hypothetical protein